MTDRSSLDKKETPQGLPSESEKKKSDDEKVDEAGEESFPASDPPAY